jgi:hypothetical protein
MNLLKIALSTLSIILTLFTLSLVASASPSVLTITGTVSNGQSITVGGSGFGMKIPEKPYLWADFNSGTINPSSLGTVTSWTSIESMAYSAMGGINNGGSELFGNFEIEKA